MKLSECKLNQRYFFFYNDLSKQKYYFFIAKLKVILEQQCIVSNWEENGKLRSGELSTPILWIDNVMTLNDIVTDTILPNEIILKIGEY